MPPVPWLRHPAIAGLRGEVRTRLGISPNYPSFRVGVLRTHLLTALFAHAIARHLDTTATVYLRCDDTDNGRTDAAHVPALLEEIHHVAVDTVPAPVRQSQRGDRYRTALDNLDQLGVLTWAEGVPFLDLKTADRLISDPATSANATVVNLRLPAGRPREHVPLARADGTALWHLASVVDDLDLGVNMIVRGTDKIDAVSIQHRLRLLLSGDGPVAHLFVPKLREPSGSPIRIAHLTSAHVRPSTIRWYLTEPCLTEGTPPPTFQHLLDRLRPVLPAPRNSYFEAARLAALDRKMSAVLDPLIAARELSQIVGAEHGDLVERVCAEQRKPLADQVTAYRNLTRQLVPPRRAAVSGPDSGPAPPATRTAAGQPTGQ